MESADTTSTRLVLLMYSYLIL